MSTSLPDRGHDPSGCDTSDADLLASARRGNQRSVEILLGRYRGFVRFKAREYFLPGAEHQDLIQEGMIGLFQAIRDFDVNRGSFIGFADLCITRKILTAVKTANRNKHRVLESAVRVDAYTTDDERGAPSPTLRFEMTASVDPSSIVESAQEIELIRKHLARTLTEMESDILGEFLQGKSYTAIASALGLHLKGVDNALQRIRKKLGDYETRRTNSMDPRLPGDVAYSPLR